MTDNTVIENETDCEFPFGRAVRIFDLGFFAVLLVVSVGFLLSGLGVIFGGSPGLFRALLSTLLGFMGTGISLAGGRNAFELLRDPRPALKITPEGILNRTYWNSTTLARWDEIVHIRRTRIFFISEIVLENPADFRRRQIWPVRLMMRVTSLLGVGTLPVYLPQIAVPGREVMARLSDALAAKELDAVREHRQIEEATSSAPSNRPESGPGNDSHL